MVRIEMTPGGESLRAAVKYFNADDVAAEDAKAAAQKAKLMDKLAAAANAPKLLIALPADIKSKALRKNTLQFNLPIGRAQPAVEAIEKDLIGSGWKRTGGNLQKETGNLQLTKDALSLSVVYMDPGFMPAEVTLTSTGVELDVK
jgi:hypothetical protein